MAEKGTGNRGKGRPKGASNKLTIELKSAILGALQEVGGQKYLVGVAEEHPAVFCALIGKLVPAEVKAQLTGEHTVTVVVKRDANFYRGSPAPRTAPTPDSDPPEPSPVQGGGVRPPVGQNGAGLNGYH